MARLNEFDNISGALFDSVKSEVRSYSNIISILEKIHYDENFALLGKTFFDILDFETVYAYTGRVMRAEEDEGGEPVDRHRGSAGRQHASLQRQP
jgi:hypothetical protein